MISKQQGMHPKQNYNKTSPMLEGPQLALSCLGSLLCDVTVGKTRWSEALCNRSSFVCVALRLGKGGKNRVLELFSEGGLCVLSISKSGMLWNAFICWGGFSYGMFFQDWGFGKKCYAFALLKLHCNFLRFIAFRNV